MIDIITICPEEQAVTVNLIDAVIALSKTIAPRDLCGTDVVRAFKKLHNDPHFQSLIAAAEFTNTHL